MASIVREYALFCIESAFDTPKTSPVTGTDRFYIPLVESNAFSAEMAPDVVETPWGGGFDVLGDVDAGTWSTKPSLKCLGYPALAAILCKWAIQRVDLAPTPDVPWTTTETAGDLATVSLYHAYLLKSGTLKRRRIGGWKAGTLTLSCSRQDPRLQISVDGIASRIVGNSVDSSTDPNGTEFPAPVDSDFPLGVYRFQHTKGNLLLAAAALTKYESLSLKVANKLVADPWEDNYPTTIGSYGRETTLDATLLLKATPDLTADMVALTRKSVAVTFNNGTNTLGVSLGPVRAPERAEGLPARAGVPAEGHLEVDVGPHGRHGPGADHHLTWDHRTWIGWPVRYGWRLTLRQVVPAKPWRRRSRPARRSALRRW